MAPDHNYRLDRAGETDGFTAGGRIGVLIVDDSAFMRSIMERIIADDPELVVAATARNGTEALELVAADAARPVPLISVITLDVEMPGLGGLEVLRRLGRVIPGGLRRYPVIVVSALTKEGAETTIQALELGAFEVVPKPDVVGGIGLLTMARELVAKIKAAAASHGHTQARSQSQPPQLPPSRAHAPQVRTDVVRSNVAATRGAEARAASDGTHPAEPPAEPPAAVLIGTSTGGPQALRQLIPALPASFPVPIVIAQHMPPGFTRPLAERLDELSPLEVREAAAGDVLAPGQVLIAPAGKQTILSRRGSFVQVVLEDKAPFATSFRPSVDLLFLTGADAYGARSAGIVLTGMGKDGLLGVRAIKKAGGLAVAEARESCVVYGMPREVAEAGLADFVAPLSDLPRLLVELVMGARSHSR